jgi:N-acetylneuraminic acid mutarotase
VLVAGGYYYAGNNVYSLSPTALLYDPATASWSLTGSMTTPRFGHVAASLGSGKILVAGGLNAYYSGTTVTTAELYDPANGQWSSAGTLSNPTSGGNTATVLADGKVLIAGGWVDGSSTTAASIASIYNPTANSWSVAAQMPVARAAHFAALLPDGTVLIVGGVNGNPWSASSYLSSAIIYQP